MDAEGTGFAIYVQVWVVKRVVAIWLGPFAKSKAVVKTGACPVNHGSKGRILVVDVCLPSAQFDEIL